MATKSIAWPSGTGSITVEYDGSGNGTIQVSSDPNDLYENRSAQITVRTTDGSNISRTVTIAQAAKVRIDISNATVTASNQTYSGSAKTPTPTVTLNGSTIPSSGYDVSYSNNTNAGTATITITGKGEYTGTATGTFNIAKASRTLSFADSYIVLNTSSNVTKTATPSAGSGDGAITYSISSTTYATINSSSGKVTSKSSDGSAVVTATIAEGTNYLSASTSYNLYVFATTHDFGYTGSSQSLTLPPGSYQLQCWGAQGGSNAANSSYSITARSGGKGGYSTGVLTLNESRTVYAMVGGQGSSSAGGFNGGGGTSETSSYNASNELGYSKMGGGGGGTDIRLDSSSYLSRMIVAGGGSGGAMCCKKVTSSTSRSETINWIFNATSYSYEKSETVNWQFYDASYAHNINNMTSYSASGGNMSWAATSSVSGVQVCLDLSAYTSYFPLTVTFNLNSVGGSGNLYLAKAVDRTLWDDYSSEFVYVGKGGTGSKTVTLTDSTHPVLFYFCNDNKPGMSVTGTTASYIETSSMTSHSASSGNMSWSSASNARLEGCITYLDLSSYSFPVSVEFTIGSTGGSSNLFLAKSADRTSWTHYGSELKELGYQYTGKVTKTFTDSTYPIVFFYCNDNKPGMSISGTKRTWTETSTTTTTRYKDGYHGGGTSAEGYHNGGQSEAGQGNSPGGFGYGGSQGATNYRYAAAGAGGGWYGGGCSFSDSDMTYVDRTGGGSGFVNIAANAGYRPSGYTGLQLDSGATYAGNTSFVAPGGGNETGHAGNGYARITRLN